MRDDKEYGYGWKSVDYIFHGGNSKDESDNRLLKEPLKHCWFDLNYLGDAGDIRIAHKMSRQDPDAYAYRPHPIYSNIMDFDDIDIVANKMIDFEKMIDRHHIEKTELIETLKKEQI